MTMTSDSIRLAFYGDDFTGSTDAMEVTAFAGLRTVLFTSIPGDDLLERFRGYDVIGIAGTSRARSPEWMEENLHEAFRALCRLNPRIVQYKVCSTFDSSPEVGSIGRAVDIGMCEVGGKWSPLVVGAPQLGRWQAFGNLFARASDGTYRLDRHPTMSRHPVTPMKESDLRIHLGMQTERPVTAVFGPDLPAFETVAQGDAPSAVFLDVFDEATQEHAGRIVWTAAMKQRAFSASSSGLQYALISHWRSAGEIPSIAEEIPKARPVDHLLVLSGSCSPVTAEQIDHAESEGFTTIRIDVIAATGEDIETELSRLENLVSTGFTQSRGVLVYAARTVDDPAYSALEHAAAGRNQNFSKAQHMLGDFMGKLVHRLVPKLSLSRIVVAGGDTSGRIIGSLPIQALEVAHPLAKGVPICHCHSSDKAFDGLQVALKGGQIGDASLFSRAFGG